MFQLYFRVIVIIGARAAQWLETLDIETAIHAQFYDFDYTEDSVLS